MQDGRPTKFIGLIRIENGVLKSWLVLSAIDVESQDNFLKAIFDIFPVIARFCKLFLDFVNTSRLKKNDSLLTIYRCFIFIIVILF